MSREILICFLAVVYAVDARNRIVGGQEGSLWAAPYQVSLQYKTPGCAQCPYVHKCGGSLIAPNVVVTTAYCVYEKERKSLLVVSGRAEISGSSGYLSPVAEIIIHEQFDTLTIDNDIALLKLTVDLPSDLAESSTIPLAKSLPPVGKNATLSGWGSLHYDGEPTEVLHLGKLPIVSPEQCQAYYYRDDITESMFCAGYQHGRIDACHGDNGGPLVYAWELVGLVSWGNGCGKENYPTVYTSIPTLREWVLSKL